MRIPVRNCCDGGCFVELRSTSDEYLISTASMPDDKRDRYTLLHELGCEFPTCIQLAQRLSAHKSIWLIQSVLDFAAWRSICRRASKIIREETSSSSSILLIPGPSPPFVFGQSARYVNKSGTVIHHPNAYRKYGKPIYKPSTLRVEVGMDWIDSRLQSK